VNIWTEGEAVTERCGELHNCSVCAIQQILSGA